MNGMSRKLLGESVWKQDTPHHPKALPCRLLTNFKGGKGTLKQRYFKTENSGIQHHNQVNKFNITHETR